MIMPKVSEASEEILEQLWVLYQEEQKGPVKPEDLNITPDTDVIQELKDAGYLVKLVEELKFTPAGFQAARQIIRNNRLAERLLHDVLDVHGKQVEEAACRLEHILIDGLDDRICTLLGHPRNCPHGHPIPPGDCCRQTETTIERIMARISDMAPNSTGVIAYLHFTDHDKLQRLMSLGVIPGRPISIIQKTPSYVIQVGYTQIAIDKEIAASIHIRLDPKNHTA